MIRRLPSAYRMDKDSKNYALLHTVSGGLDDIGSVTDAVEDAHSLEAASGNSLDQIGALFNQLRSGYDDDTYKLFIQSTRDLLQSCGSASDIRKIMAYLMRSDGDMSHFTLIDSLSDTAFMARCDGSPTKAFSMTVLNEFVNAARPAGVKYLDDELVIALNRLFERDSFVFTLGLSCLMYLIREADFSYGSCEYGSTYYFGAIEVERGCRGDITDLISRIISGVFGYLDSLAYFGEGVYGAPVEEHVLSDCSLLALSAIFGYGTGTYGEFDYGELHYGSPAEQHVLSHGQAGVIT